MQQINKQNKISVPIQMGKYQLTDNTTIYLSINTAATTTDKVK